ncbi:MAG: DUF4259 domain-containing protein [Pirellulaceae bacterium]|nr:DUF4259 domain-containing protein [Pirellulaceae bacterium]
MSLTESQFIGSIVGLAVGDALGYHWIEENLTVVPDDLKAAADSAIVRILGSDSELSELWDEGGRNIDWHNAIDDLRERIQG